MYDNVRNRRAGFENHRHSRWWFIRRVRNSLSHGNFNISENLVISFKDIDPRNKLDEFEIEIQLSDFGEFINSFMLAAKTQKFMKKNA